MDKVLLKESKKKIEYFIAKLEKIEKDKKESEDLSWDLMLLSEIEED